mmetsp:Transcript_28920/g.62025  ORF Transcript_28920/g.62025 Transcript_28920/m.62025 type:complete len:80 (+) Transcript_28920:988-1227(+)
MQILSAATTTKSDHKNSIVCRPRNNVTKGTPKLSRKHVILFLNSALMKTIVLCISLDHMIQYSVVGLSSLHRRSLLLWQ